MRGYNVIWIYDAAAEKALFCVRRGEPYAGLLNLVGGKIEPGEDGLAAAHRELREEAGIVNIKLVHLMDFVYYQREACRVEVYAGRLAAGAEVRGGEEELRWLGADEDFFDAKRFAGEGNIGHIREIVKQNHDRLG